MILSVIAVNMVNIRSKYISLSTGKAGHNMTVSCRYGTLEMTLQQYDWVPIYAGFRLTCRLPHCRFDDDICSTAQAPLAAEGWPSGKQRQTNRSITLPLCPPRQIADSWIVFNSGAFAARWKAKAALPLRAATLKQQAMITRHSGKAASGKLVWNQHYAAKKPV